MEKAYRTAKAWEQKLTAILGTQAYERDVEHAVTQTIYEEIILSDYSKARSNYVEEAMWKAHLNVIERFRANIASLKTSSVQKKRTVESRKLVTAFISFLKSASKFYRGFIQRLACQFSLSEIAPVLKQFHLAYEVTKESIRLSPKLRPQLLQTVHQSLVILGDLSRYREGDAKEKNWGPAIGYYNIARRLLADLGAPHNQLAVIARADGSVISATYHLYRAVSVKQPFPQSDNNLELNFNKLLKAHREGKLDSLSKRKEEKTVSDLLTGFLILHAYYAKGIELPDHETLQTDMLLQLSSDLRELHISAGMLNKLVFINIAAQYHASQKWEGRCSSMAFSHLLKLNVQTFTTLLRVFQSQLEALKSDSDNTADKLSAVGKRMLSSLRLYSRWLVANNDQMISEVRDKMQLKQFWQTYADTMSILSSSFPLETLPQLDYLLDEDEEMTGFVPLMNDVALKDEAFKSLPLETDTSHHVHPNEEMLARILHLLCDCEELCADSAVPVTILDGLITYREEGSVVFTPSIGTQHHGTVVFDGVSRQSVTMGPYPERPSLAQTEGRQSFEANNGSITVSEPGSLSMSVRLDRMVDSLVGPRDDPIPEYEEGEDDVDELEENNVFVAQGPRSLPQGSPIIERMDPEAPKGPSPRALRQARTPLQVNDLVNFVQTFSQRLATGSPSTPMNTWGNGVFNGTSTSVSQTPFNPALSQHPHGSQQAFSSYPSQHGTQLAAPPGLSRPSQNVYPPSGLPQPMVYSQSSSQQQLPEFKMSSLQQQNFTPSQASFSGQPPQSSQQSYISTMSSLFMAPSTPVTRERDPVSPIFSSPWRNAPSASSPPSAQPFGNGNTDSFHFGTGT